MPVTNFQSVISTQTLGTADVDKLAASFDKMSASIDGATQKANKVNEHPGFNAFAEKVKQGIENPLAAIGGAAEDALKAMGPVGAGVAATAGVFAAAAAAGFEAARALGEYGVQIRDVQLRTGMAAKEVAEYSFAARAVGQDVSILDRLMRGLTMAVEDQGSKGEKARGWLSKFGVDIGGLRDGTASTSDALTKVGAGLESLPAGVMRSAAAIDIFKRAGIEAIPFLVELNANLKTGAGLPAPTEESIARWAGYTRELAALDTQWAALKRDAMEPLALTVLWTIKTAGAAGAVLGLPGDIIGNWLFGGTPSATTVAMGDTGGWGVGGSMSRSAHAAEARSLAYNNTRVAAAQAGGTDQEKLTNAKHALAELQGSLKTDVLPSANDKTFTDIANQQGVIAGLEARIAATKKLADEIKGVIKAIEQQTKVDNDYTGKLLAGGRQLYLNANPAEAPVQWSPQQSWMLGGVRRSTGDLTGEEFAKWFFDNQYHQGQRDLKDARDNEKRGIGLYGAQASLGGVSEIAQITSVEALRKKYADQEYDALRAMAEAKNDEQAKQDALDQQHQKYLDAEIERQQALLQLALRQKQEFQALAVGLFDAVLHGGTAAFLKQQAEHLFDQVVGNAAGMAWGSVSRVIPHAKDPNSTLGKLLGGTMFGADPLKAATDANTMATVDNTMELRALRAQALSGSGGGGSAGGGAGGWLGRITSVGTGPGAGVGYPSNDPYGWAAGPDRPDMPTDATNPESTDGSGWGFADASDAGGGGRSSAMRGAGIGAAAIGGGFGIYRGIKAGGARGALSATGSAVGMIGAIGSLLIPSLSATLGPIGMALGMGLGLVSTLLGDPRKARGDDLAKQAAARSFTMPTGADYNLDASGRYDDYNYRGQVRSTTYNVYAMDSTSFRDYLIANPGALSAGLTSAIQGGNADDVVGSLAARSN